MTDDVRRQTTVATYSSCKYIQWSAPKNTNRKMCARNLRAHKFVYLRSQNSLHMYLYLTLFELYPHATTINHTLYPQQHAHFTSTIHPLFVAG